MQRTLSKGKFSVSPSNVAVTKRSSNKWPDVPMGTRKLEKKYEMCTSRQRWENLMKKSMYLKKIVSNDIGEQLLDDDSDISDNEK